MLKFRPAKIYLAAASALALSAAAALSMADNFTANRSVVQPGETLELTYTADQAKSQDIYLAVVLDNSILFMDENGGFSPYTPGTATPPRLRSPAAGNHNMLTFAMPDGFFHEVTVYQAAGKPGSDVLAPGNYDAASLRSLNLSFRQKTVTQTADGRSLYATHCASCHDANPARNRDNILRGTNPQTTLAAINTDKGGMGYLSTLTSAEINAIATWIGNPI